MNTSELPLNVGMIGLGMIFEETYRSLLTFPNRQLVYHGNQPIHFTLHSTLTRTGSRSDRLKNDLPTLAPLFKSYIGDVEANAFFADPDLHLVVVATPDARHFQYARNALETGKHVLIEKPSVLDLHELDQLISLAQERNLLAKVVYHKLFDPDHRMLRTHILDGRLQHVNSGYCSLLEPKSISGSQFSEWIDGRNPATYVAVHYLKLIDFTFGSDITLHRVEATGQRGIVGSPDGPTWDSVQVRVVYRYPDQREAAFDIHTSWVNPDTFQDMLNRKSSSDLTMLSGMRINVNVGWSWQSTVMRNLGNPPRTITTMPRRFIPGGTSAIRLWFGCHPASIHRSCNSTIYPQ